MEVMPKLQQYSRVINLRENIIMNWFDANENLPDKEQDCLVELDDGSFYVGWFMDGLWLRLPDFAIVKSWCYIEK